MDIRLSTLVKIADYFHVSLDGLVEHDEYQKIDKFN